MKQLTCEMCGSTELMKQDGVFVCQTCGTKYSVEEAKKMMVEGTVEVKGTVKVDDSSKIDNYYKMAESAYNAGNKQEAENYCNKIIEIDPENYKAWFLKGKAAGWQSTLANNRLQEAINCFVTAINNATDDDKENIKNQIIEETTNLNYAFLELYCKRFKEYPSSKTGKELNIFVTELFSSDANLIIFPEDKPSIRERNLNKFMILYSDAYRNTDDFYKEYARETYPSSIVWEEHVQQVENVIEHIKIQIAIIDTYQLVDNLGADTVISLYETIICLYDSLSKSAAYEYDTISSSYVRTGESKVASEMYKNERKEFIEYSKQKIKELDPNYDLSTLDSDYEIPEGPNTNINNTSGSGCYVATCVYGSYDCPEVWTLRRYRDNTLAESWYGRAFIHMYYTISPTIVKWFGDTEWFKNMWRGKLDKMVSNLQKNGVESTPYKDRQW